MKLTRYTRHGQRADIYIHQLLELIVKKILIYCEGDTVLSIMLSGSYGNGEGSIAELADGTIVPLSDFDIVIITANEVPEKRIRLLMSEIRNMLKLKCNNPYFEVDLKFFTMKEFAKRIPNISASKVRYSTVLYGKDLRGLVNEAVMPIDSVMILVHRACEVIKSAFYLQERGIDVFTRCYINYQLNKCIMDIFLVYFILRKGLNIPSYREELDICKVAAEDILPLNLIKLKPLICDSIERKINDKKYFYEADSTKLYAFARKVLRMVIFDLFSSINISTASPRKLSFDLNRKFICSRILSFIKLENGLLELLLSPIVGIFDTLRFALKRRRLKVRDLFFMASPLMRIYAAIIYLFLGLNDVNVTGAISFNEQYVKKSYDAIKSLTKLDNYDPRELFNSILQLLREYYDLKNIFPV